MNYVVVTNEWLSAHGIMPLPTMRKTKDGSKVLLHEDYLSPFIDETVERYPHESPELNDLLSGDEWQYDEETAPTESSDFIQVAAIRNLMQATRNGINAMDLSDSEALRLKDVYPQWSDYIGKKLTKGTKVQYDGKLIRVRQDINPVLENQPPGIYTAALYEEINESHAGTADDPIPYNEPKDPLFAGMELVQGKYYTQGGVTYYCWNGSGQAVYNDLKDLTTFVKPVTA